MRHGSQRAMFYFEFKVGACLNRSEPSRQMYGFTNLTSTVMAENWMVLPDVLMTRSITTSTSSGRGRRRRSVMKRLTMKRLRTVDQHITIFIAP